MITKQKGTYDLYGDKSNTYLYIKNVIESIIQAYKYEFIKTPTFEASQLFHRTVGETADIVTKETYDFKDRGDRDITLRPEGTAGIVRSFIENKMYSDNTGPKKLWYLGSMFRYERPQSGRYREFTQFGCEALGSSSAMLDAEMISIPVMIFELLGLNGVKVKINSLGNIASREKYKEALIEYFRPHIDELCSDCKMRFLKNPLRILDCKVDKDNEVLKKAPTPLEFLDEESQKHFDDVIKYLEALDLSYEVDSRIIRGLDYYTHTVFEIEADIEGFGAQNVMCAGGRYDNLVKDLDGPDTKAVGFAIGIERLMLALEYEKTNIPNKSYLDTYIMYLGEEAKSEAFALNHLLRVMGFKSDMDYLGRSIKSNFKQAENLNAKFAIIIGEDELKNKYLTIRNMITKKEEKVANKELIKFLDNESIDACDCDECDCDECHCDDCHCEDDECDCDECHCDECHCEHDECDCDECSCHNK